MEITKALKADKRQLLSYFRLRFQEARGEIEREHSAKDFKKRAQAVNTKIAVIREQLLEAVRDTAIRNEWPRKDILETILMISYTSYVVMLEFRNSYWEYDYMAFSRRIGELWEPFCKLCFAYSLKDLSFYIPPLFSEVETKLSEEILDYISGLKLTDVEKNQLIKYYNKVWKMVDSGAIQLEMDLHFSQGDNYYVVDYKSGFGSNEKGNTNRLLMVGSIYQNLEDHNYKCMLFVRSPENNHYLNTLANSGIWETFCGENAYAKMKLFTGFDIKEWINTNIDWVNDFDADMKATIEKNELKQYLDW